ncbi:hypothetical protein DFH27DRAFT_567583 [Peziza echinospora]|nr:hypothetical protein DFH27DRAFT_567583 [Peziza echinospora]
MPPRKRTQVHISTASIPPTTNRDGRAAKRSRTSESGDIPTTNCAEPAPTQIPDSEVELKASKQTKPRQPAARGRRQPLGTIENLSMGQYGPDLGENPPTKGKPKGSKLDGGKDDILGAQQGMQETCGITSVQKSGRSVSVKKATKLIDEERSITTSSAQIKNETAITESVEITSDDGLLAPITTLSLRDRLKAHLPSDIKYPLPTTEDPDELAQHLTAQRLWTPELLAEFQHTAVTRIVLTPPGPTAPAGHDYTPLITVFFNTGVFTALTYLSLSPLSFVTHSQISLLRILPSLKHLDLSSTHISTRSLYHLSPHWKTLTTLNITGNPGISDEAYGPLTALDNLENLYLAGTSFSMPGLRRLATLQKEATAARIAELAFELPSSTPPRPPTQCRIMSIPRACEDYLNSLQRAPRYCPSIPAGMGYVTDSRMVDNLQLEALKRNLALHAKYCKDVGVTGSKVELVARLKGILENMAGDARFLRAMGTLGGS